MKVYYIWDAYCGWCYGFEKVFVPFVENHDELEVEMISGGLFFGKKLKEYPQMLDINKQIAAIFDVEFGSDYEELFVEGELALNSMHPAIAFSVFRKYLPTKKQANLAYRMQETFYTEGRVLADVEVYRDLAKEFNLDAEKIVAEIAEGFAKKDIYHEDFIRAQKLGAQGFPTLLIEKDGKMYDLRSGAMTLEELEKNYKIIKNA